MQTLLFIPCTSLSLLGGVSSGSMAGVSCIDADCGISSWVSVFIDQESWLSGSRSLESPSGIIPASFVFIRLFSGVVTAGFSTKTLLLLALLSGN